MRPSTKDSFRVISNLSLELNFQLQLRASLVVLLDCVNKSEGTVMIGLANGTKAMDDGRGQVTELLQKWAGGDAAAFDRLLPLVYGELRRLADRSMHRERP